MIYDFSVMSGEDLLADVHMDTTKHEFEIKRYIFDERQPFKDGVPVNIHYLYGFLESRCIDNGWPIMPMILRGNDINVYEECRRTHGVRDDDDLWLRFPE